MTKRLPDAGRALDRAVSGRAVGSVAELVARTGRQTDKLIKMVGSNAIRGRGTERLAERRSEIEMQPTVVQLWFVVEFMFFVFVLLELARPKCGSPHFNQITTSNRPRHCPTGMVGIREFNL